MYIFRRNKQNKCNKDSTTLFVVDYHIDKLLKEKEKQWLM